MMCNISRIHYPTIIIISTNLHSRLSRKTFMRFPKWSPSTRPPSRSSTPPPPPTSQPIHPSAKLSKLKPGTFDLLQQALQDIKLYQVLMLANHRKCKKLKIQSRSLQYIPTFPLQLNQNILTSFEVKYCLLIKIVHNLHSESNYTQIHIENETIKYKVNPLN